MCYTAILQYIAVCFLDEAIIGHTHMMIMDYALCMCVCVCVHVFRREKLLTGKPCWPMRRNFYVIVYMVASVLYPV